MEPAYNKGNPFITSIKERYSLCKQGSGKNTHHLVLDLKGSGLQYQVGDSIGIYPQHGSELVQQTLDAIKAVGKEMIVSKQDQETHSLSHFLTHKANLTDIPPKLFREVCARQTNSDKKHRLETLLQSDQREAYKHYISQHEVWDFLQSNEEVTFTPQEIADLLMPLLPRFYSISSSQHYVGDEVHLTVAHFEYETRGYKRRGVCTHYICHLAELGNPVIPIFVQPSHGFRLPEDNHAPVIMIGPGTGVAPFRAFMQERIFRHQSQGKHWLFFGERNRALNFFYETEWNQLAEKGHFKVDAAFSRDQEHKVYVQHKIQEQGAELYQWLEEGAYLYVCGDAKAMAKDVEAALHDVIQHHGSKTPQEAKEYVKRLRHDKRYLRDVY